MRLPLACCLSALILAGCASEPHHPYIPPGQPVVTKAKHLEITGGDHQFAPYATFLDNPLEVCVTDDGGQPLNNVPVIFADQTDPSGHVSQERGGEVATQMTAFSDADGIAKIWYAMPAAPGTPVRVKATALGSTVTFREQTFMSTGNIAPPTNTMIFAGPDDGQMTVAWTNHADNAGYILIQRSIDNTCWVTIAKVDPKSHRYIATLPNPDRTYYYGVIAGNSTRAETH